MRTPRGPNYFNFRQFLGTFGKIVCWHFLDGWRPHLGEILDPPLKNPKAGLKKVLEYEARTTSSGSRIYIVYFSCFSRCA